MTPDTPIPARRDGLGDWSDIVKEWWEKAVKSVAAKAVWDDWAYLQAEVCLYHFQMWWDMHCQGKDGEAVRAYAELRQQVQMLYLTPPDRIRGQRDGSLPEKLQEPAKARRAASGSRARLSAVRTEAQ